MSEKQSRSGGVGPVSVISAIRGGNAQRVLEEIVISTKHLSRQARVFVQEAHVQLLETGECNGDIHAKTKRGAHPIVLKLITERQIATAEQEGLVLVDNNRVKRWSCRPTKGTYRQLAIGLGTFSSSVITHIANSVIACWVLRPAVWKDRNSTTYTQPYGAEAKPKRPSSKYRKPRSHNRRFERVSWM